MAIRFKAGVSVEGIQVVTIKAIYSIANYMNITTAGGMVVTSVCDGTHMKGSLHYKGLAFDLRTWTTKTSGKQVTSGKKEEIAFNLRRILGDPWQVIVEKTHIHVEFDEGGD